MFFEIDLFYEKFQFIVNLYSFKTQIKACYQTYVSRGSISNWPTSQSAGKRLDWRTSTECDIGSGSVSLSSFWCEAVRLWVDPGWNPIRGVLMAGNIIEMGREKKHKFCISVLYGTNKCADFRNFYRPASQHRKQKFHAWYIITII